ncbi:MULTISPECIES: hypothetical protein [Pelosinus]|uniref:Pilus assembly protein PilP n=1 Tax=Pelosinus fermentans B4 TaxID=1149862 RepID=I8RFI7_9FIRM|nr:MULTISPECIES: hypothetical protein [Pelosinus]EIW18293.1 Pilus assembly protein PilP [Pelosinus fermentans B4]EIW24279.1 hypothetical protein FA11_3468 [Pelosinus fermentans A11]OAM94275.1 Pilus assembly protein PilP [Pelosinus fermentans DSM 17108]SDR04870.1 hypothetical protein SAMN04515679_2398 [Pelosinus fermentans]
MEKLKQLEKLTAKQRLRIMFVIGVTAIIVTFFFIPSKHLVAPSVVNKTTTPTVRNTDKVVMSVEHQHNGQLKRDPFASPSIVTDNLKTQKDNTSPAKSNNESVTAANPTSSLNRKEKIRLTGIINTKNQHVAVIQSDNKSKTYQLDEFIGTYQLISIQEDSIILKSGNSQMFLSLEPAGKGRVLNNE